MRDKSNSWLIRAIVVLIAVVLGLFGYILSKEVKKKSQINIEIEALRQEAEKIEKENMRMEERIDYFASKDYREREAKEKLNLQNPDERVAIITQTPARREEKNPEASQAYKEPSFQPDPIPNWQKWWNYFFE